MMFRSIERISQVMDSESVAIAVSVELQIKVKKIFKKLLQQVVSKVVCVHRTHVPVCRKAHTALTYTKKQTVF